MPKLDRYLFREFTQSFVATLIVLLVVSLGGVLTDLLGKIAEGKVPAGLMFSQLGLRLLNFLPLILPLALMLGLLLAFAQLYRNSEMPVLASIGVGPRRLLRPLLMLVVPVVAVIALLSLWLGPWADRTRVQMVEQANRSVIAAGLDAGRFTTLANGSVVYVGAISGDGTRMNRVFMQRQRDDRVDVVTATGGDLFFDGDDERYMRLTEGFRVEGPLGEGRDYRLMRFASNEFALPVSGESHDDQDPELLPTHALLGDARPTAVAQLHARITPPLLALAFALLTLPLSRSSPRQARYGRVILGFLGYLVGVSLMFNGTQMLADGKLPPAVGMWWLSLPLLAAAVWFYLRDGHLGKPKAVKA